MKSLRAILLFLTFAAVISGQTAEKPVSMSEEPFHHRVLKNESIEVFEVKLPVGALMKFHEHPTDHFAVVINPGQMENETVAGRIITNPPIAPGTVVFLPAGDAHRQTNIDKSEIHFVAGEILRGRSSSQRSAAKTDGCRNLIFENERIAAFSCRLKPGESNDSVQSASPFLRIFISPGKMSRKNSPVPAGTVGWFESRKKSRIRNVGNANIHVVEIELK